MDNRNCLIDRKLLYNIRKKELEEVLKYFNFMVELNRARVALEKAYSECPALFKKTDKYNGGIFLWLNYGMKFQILKGFIKLAI